MAKKLTEKEKTIKRIERETDKFMESVNRFLEKKNNGSIPEEWSASLLLLRTYYKQFLLITDEVEHLDSIVVDSRYGKVCTPLLTSQAQAAVRIENYIKEFGLSLKQASKLDIIEPVAEESTLDKFMKEQIEKR